MPRPGGASTLAGVSYEVRVVLWQVREILKGNTEVLRYQPVSSAFQPTDKPLPVHTDDISLRDVNGQERYYQAKQNTKDPDWTIRRLEREGVFRQFLLQWRKKPECDLCLVSNLPAQPLQNVAQLARETISSDEFEEHWTNSIRQDAETIMGMLELQTDELWRFLKNVTCVHLTGDMIDSSVSDFLSGRYADPKKAALVLKEYVQKDPGKDIDQSSVEKELAEAGLYPLLTSDHKAVVDELKTASAMLKGHRSQIHDVHIERQEVGELLEWIHSYSTDKNEIAFLIDVAGSGKSTVMKDLLEQLEEEKIPTLAIKADQLGSAENESALGGALGLSHVPEVLLSSATREGKAVLLVDQLDALSQTFARNQECLSLMLRLLERASTITNVCVIASCRDFDRRFDPKIRQIQCREFRLKTLTQDQVQSVLDKLEVTWEQLSGREQTLLVNPQNLLCYADVVSERRARGEGVLGVATLQDLYNELWKLKIEHPRTCVGNTADLRQTVYLLADAVSSSQLLHQPTSLLDSHTDSTRYLESVGLLSRSGMKVGFFHQSFFDYCFSRRFTSQNCSLSEFVFSGNQGFFVRAQIIQVLSYLRSTNEGRYLEEMESLLWPKRGRTLRFHLKNLLLAWLGQQKGLMDSEKILGLRCLDSASLLNLLLGGARGNEEWYDAIADNLSCILQNSEETIDLAVWFLTSIVDARPDDVFGILRQYIGTSERWDSRITRCLALYKTWQSGPARDVLLAFCSQPISNQSHMSSIMDGVTKANVKLACETLKVLLDRALADWLATGENEEEKSDHASDSAVNVEETSELEARLRHSRDFDDRCKSMFSSDQYWIEPLARKASVEEPFLFTEVVLEWLFKCLPELVRYDDGEKWMRDAVFVWAFSNVRVGDSHLCLIEGLRTSLTTIAESNEDVFLSHAERIARTRHLVLHQVLARVLIDTASKHATWATGYLVANHKRLHIPEELSGGNISAKLVSAVFPHLGVLDRERLEQAILAYSPKWENNVESLHLRGCGQHDLLWGVADQLLSEDARRRKHELQRKFPGRQPRQPSRATATCVGSPIPFEKCQILSDDDWLRAMRYFDESTDWSNPRRDFGKGGIVELSRCLEAAVKENPTRFLNLLPHMDESIPSMYISALVSGLCQSEIDSGALFSASETVVSRRGTDEAVQGSICRMLHKKAIDRPPTSLIEYVRSLALTSPDPEQDLFKVKSDNGQMYYDGDPLDNGINTIRGQAVEAYVLCEREASEPDVALFWDTLFKVAQDSSLAVRACLIRVLPYVLQWDRESVLQVFAEAIEGAEELICHRLSHQVIYYSLGSHAGRMLPYIRLLAVSRDLEACEAGGRLAALAAFKYTDAKTVIFWYSSFLPRIAREMSKLIRGMHPRGLTGIKAEFRRLGEQTNAFKKGMATVYAHNIGSLEVREQCLKGLSALCRRSPNSVLGQVGQAFERLPSPVDSAVAKFCHRFLSTNLNHGSAGFFLDYITKHSSVRPMLALRAGETILRRFREGQGLSNEYHWHLDDQIVNLIVSLYSTSANDNVQVRAMDLFDRVMEHGSVNAREVLRSLDR